MHAHFITCKHINGSTYVNIVLINIESYIDSHWSSVMVGRPLCTSTCAPSVDLEDIYYVIPYVMMMVHIMQSW